ncbi:MAG: type II toxin-antitoxin system ParD family antitoxin [Verrucomicrobia bacterium]|nr:type II toxin-antitoxin system ParD family antitoxin [Verrucomicrobiota bacterium]
MNVPLPKHWEDYVNQAVASGEFGSPGEVVRAALREMRDRHEKKLLVEFKAAFAGVDRHAPVGEPTLEDVEEIGKVIAQYRKEKRAGR